MRRDYLTKLAIKYGTDRHPESRKHSYTPYYYDLFKNRRKSIKKVLEIGVGQGAGLRMWRDFFPNAQIYGADYRESLMIKRDRIESFLCDQRRKEHLINLIDNIGPNIDLVIDDASHRPRDQIFTCLNLMPLLNKGVTYVIEDVADPSIIERLSQYDFKIPKLQYINRYDNRLVIVKHKKKSKDKQTNISFFAKLPFRVGPDKHLSRVSSLIRAVQIADYIGAKLNPSEGYQNDICIYVKPPYKAGDDILFRGKPYFDIVDGVGFYPLLRNHPEVTVISLSDWNYHVLKRSLTNKIINIPQQHCNFERVLRKRKEVTTVGIIGTLRAFEYLPGGLEDQIKKRGMELIKFSKFYTRQDIIGFYLSIDVQIIWRPYYDYHKDILVNPLKIVNASSFGIPTIAYDEPAFKEVDSCYIPVSNLTEFLAELDNLRSNPTLYKKYSKRCLKKAEEYHIEKIAKLYEQLK